MTDIDTNNKSIIKKLVKNHFSLKPESLKRFNEAIEQPKMLNNIAEFFKDSEDNRVRYKIPTEKLEDIDAGWYLFKDKFFEFTSFYNEFKYSDFANNKILIGKNSIKLQKTLIKFYTDSKHFYRKFIEDFLKWLYENRYIPTRINLLQKLNGLIAISIDDKIYDSIEEIEPDDIKEFIKKEITIYISIIMEKVGIVKFSANKSIEIVFSRNFADWFLCSTKNSWTSCLNCSTTYGGALWSGLPGTIVDKNRIMIYLSDGSKKTYQGIQVDKALQRVWAIYTKDNTFKVLRWYESKKIPNSFLKELSGLTFDLLDDKKTNVYSYWKSKEPIDFLYHDNNTSCFIYMDYSDYSDVNKKNIYIKGREEKGFRHIYSVNGINHLRNESNWSLWSDDYELKGLNTMIEQDYNLSSYKSMIDDGDNNNVIYNIEEDVLN